MKTVQKTYEQYWQSKKGLETFTDYERNLALGTLIKGDEKVLDLACGEGAVGEYFQELGCKVIGMDIAPEALKKVRERGLEAVKGDVEGKLPFADSTFDLVFWGDNVEHLFDPEKTLHEINRVLKPGGRLILSCPNMGYWRYRLSYLIHGMVPPSEWFRANSWQWEHIRFFNKSVMAKFLTQGGLKMEKFIGISRRRIDRPWLSVMPSLFGMIMLIEAVKK